jgi:hypothetical protein
MLRSFRTERQDNSHWPVPVSHGPDTATKRNPLPLVVEDECTGICKRQEMTLFLRFLLPAILTLAAQQLKKQKHGRPTVRGSRPHR